MLQPQPIPELISHEPIIKQRVTGCADLADWGALLLAGRRRVAAEVLEQLHASEILQEQARYKRWQAACEAWRTLRSRHAVACFCTHVSQELAEPAERLQLFEQLRQGQQEAHTQLLKLCSRLHQLSPPHLNSQMVARRVADASQWLEGWQQQLGKFQQGLQRQEQQLEDKVCVDGSCDLPWQVCCHKNRPCSSRQL